MAENLVFSQPASEVSTDLVFGASEATPTHFDLSLVGTMPGLTMTARVSLVASMSLAGTMPGLTMTASVAYFTNTSRPEIYETRTFAQVATPTESGISQPEQHAVKFSSGVSAPWADAQSVSDPVNVVYSKAQRTDTVQTSTFEDAVQAGSQLNASMQDGDKQWLRFFSRFQEADRLAAARLTGQFEDGWRDRRPSTVSKFQEAVRRVALQYRGTARPALPVVFGRDSRFQEAWVPRPGQYVPPVIPPQPPEYWGTALLFKCPPATVNLVFGYDCTAGPTGTVTVPIQRVYIVINDVSLRRISGNINIPTLSMSMSLDVDSWTWSASAALPGSALDSVAPNSNGDPVEVAATINGVEYRFMVESISRDRSFGQSALRVGMRGKTALLDAPYAPVLNFGNLVDRTMAQLVGDVLTLNGVSFDWTYDWMTESWVVPAGVFQHQGTYISAVNALANAAGAYVSPHAYNQSLRILPRYPSAPWEWASVTPDLELPSAVTTQEGIEWINRPQYNRVFVSGVGQGVLGQITRTGTAGDLLAPMVTDALITDVVGARLRGLAVLSDTGRIANVSLKLPVLPATGVITPGKMIRYVDGSTVRTGITRSVSVSVGASAVDLRQTIAVETHE